MDKEYLAVLERMAKAQEQIAGTLGKPENKFLLVLQYGAGVVTVFGIIAIVDIVVKWITGG